MLAQLEYDGATTQLAQIEMASDDTEDQEEGGLPRDYFRKIP